MRWVVALLCFAGALVAPASAAASFPDSTFENQCQYSYDRYWRPVPMIFGGRLTNGSGTELTPGAQLAVGDTVRLQAATVSAILPSWITTFAYESGMIPLGDGEIPVKAYLALEATNTAEGVRAPIELTTVARTHVVLTSGGIVDEARSSVLVDRAPIPTQSWTAIGGDVQVRQGLAESMPAMPIGRDGALVNVRGSLFVDAALTFPSGDLFHLYLDCLQGEQVDQGSTHTDVVPGPLATVRVPGFTGALGATALPGVVEADLLSPAAPARLAAGATGTLDSGALRVRLTDAQRAAWFGGATSAVISGTVDLTGAGSTQGTQTVIVDQAVTLPATGEAALTLPLEDSTWTAADGNGIKVRGANRISLQATVAGDDRPLTLTRVSMADPYPFAHFLRPGPPPTPITPPGGGGGGTQPPAATVTPVATAVPTATPTATPEPGVAKVASKSLKVKSNRVSASLSCAGGTTCRGTVKLRSAVKVKKQFVTLTKSVRYSVGAGKKATVRLTLSSTGKRYVRGKKRLSVVLDVKPVLGKTVSKKLKLSR